MGANQSVKSAAANFSSEFLKATSRSGISICGFWKATLGFGVSTCGFAKCACGFSIRPFGSVKSKLGFHGSKRGFAIPSCGFVKSTLESAVPCVDSADEHLDLQNPNTNLSFSHLDPRHPSEDFASSRLDLPDPSVDLASAHVDFRNPHLTLADPHSDFRNDHSDFEFSCFATKYFMCFYKSSCPVEPVKTVLLVGNKFSKQRTAGEGLRLAPYGCVAHGEGETGRPSPLLFYSSGWNLPDTIRRSFMKKQQKKIRALFHLARCRTRK